MTLAGLEGADVGRTTALCLVRDAHETRIGDVPSVGRAYMTTAAPEATWWAAFAASYHELRASAQGRSRQQLAEHSQPAETAETD
jgi:hypothetical protein